MKPFKTILSLIVLILLASSLLAQTWSIVLHGGAGGMKKENFTQEQIDSYQTELLKA